MFKELHHPDAPHVYPLYPPSLIGSEEKRKYKTQNIDWTNLTLGHSSHPEDVGPIGALRKYGLITWIQPLSRAVCWVVPVEAEHNATENLVLRTE